MKKIITAIGNEELNNRLKFIKEIEVKTKDIQYQEGILEALDKYEDIDVIILNEEIIGTMTLEELISEIILIKNNIKIVLVAVKPIQVKYPNIIKTVTSSKDYVNEIERYLTNNIYINQKNETSEDNENTKKNCIDKIMKANEAMRNHKITYKRVIKKKEKKAIVIIGNAGVRQNYIYFYII